VNKYFTTKRD